MHDRKIYNMIPQKNIICLSNHEKCFLHDSYTSDTSKLLKLYPVVILYKFVYLTICIDNMVVLFYKRYYYTYNFLIIKFNILNSGEVSVEESWL
jgi:hypothetical protein